MSKQCRDFFTRVVCNVILVDHGGGPEHIYIYIIVFISLVLIVESAFWCTTLWFGFTWTTWFQSYDMATPVTIAIHQLGKTQLLRHHAGVEVFHTSWSPNHLAVTVRSGAAAQLGTVDLWCSNSGKGFVDSIEEVLQPQSSWKYAFQGSPIQMLFKEIMHRRGLNFLCVVLCLLCLLPGFVWNHLFILLPPMCLCVFLSRRLHLESDLHRLPRRLLHLTDTLEHLKTPLSGASQNQALFFEGHLREREVSWNKGPAGKPANPFLLALSSPLLAWIFLFSY